MTHLKVTQSDTSEMIGSSSNLIGAKVIKDLYEKTLNGVDNTSELSGVVSVDKAHRNAVEYLLDHTDLRISVTGGYYIGFLDPLVELLLLTRVGDSFGITETQAANYLNTQYHELPGIFHGTDITAFDELAYFTKLNNFGWSTAPWSDGTGFSDCTKLTTIDVSNFGCNNYDSAYSKATFRGCNSLVTVKNCKFTAIATYMFHQCNKLTSIDLSNITQIGPNGLAHCYQLNVKLNGLDFSKLTYIGDYAFYKVPNIGDVEVPNANCALDRWFIGCESITSLSNCPNITHISGPTTSWAGQFDGCTNLDTIDLSTSTNVTKMSRGTAQNVPNLRILKMPNSITLIESLAINNCPNLLAFVIEATTPPTKNNDSFSTFSSLCKFYVPDGSVSAYLTSWSSYSSRIFSLTLYAIDFPND